MPSHVWPVVFVGVRGSSRADARTQKRGVSVMVGSHIVAVERRDVQQPKDKKKREKVNVTVEAVALRVDSFLALVTVLVNGAPMARAEHAVETPMHTWVNSNARRVMMKSSGRDQIATAIARGLARSSDRVLDNGLVWLVGYWDELAPELTAELGLSVEVLEQHLIALDPEGRVAGLEYLQQERRWRAYMLADIARGARQGL